MRNTFAILFLLALALLVYVGNAAEPALTDDADGAHAVAAREILETGDWAVLHINGVRWLEKAPLHYWLVAASYAVLGESDFSTRLPLALAMAALALMVFEFGRHFFGARAGFYAGLAISTGIGAFIFTRSMIPEAIYALEFTAAFYLFLRAWTGSLSPRAGYWGAATVVALAVLTRGLIGVIFPAAVIALFLLATDGWSRIARDWRRLPLLSSAVIFLLIAAPWHILVGLRAPGFFSFYFINEHFLRALGMRYPQDYGSVPLLYWWAAHLVWFFPWSAFLPLAFREIPRPAAWRTLHDAAGQARLLLTIWAGFILMFFSISRRMEYYSFGAWPAVALLIGLGLAHAQEECHKWLPRLSTALAVLGLLLAAALGAMLWISRGVPAGQDISRLLQLKDEEFYRVAMSTFFDLTPRAFADLRLPAAGAALALLLGPVVAWMLRRRRRHVEANVALASAMGVFLFAANLGFAAFSPHMSSRPLAEVLLPLLQPDDQVVIYGDYYMGCTLGYYTHRKTWIYNGRLNALEFGSNFSDAPKIFLTDNDFPALWRGTQRVFLFAPQHHRREALLRLPPGSAWLLADIGGKAIYANRPLLPGQPTLASVSQGP